MKKSIIILANLSIFWACNSKPRATEKSSADSLLEEIYKHKNNYEKARMLIEERSKHRSWMIKMYKSLKNMGYSENTIWNKIDSSTALVYNNLPKDDSLYFYYEKDKRIVDSIMHL